MTAHLLRRSRRYSLNETATLVTQLAPTVTGWAARVVVNGGAAPSVATINALDIFYKALEAASLISKLVAVNTFAPDNLVASITPLIVGGGSDPWTNYNFVSGDLTSAGLQGNGSNKYLRTGINPSTVYSGSGNFGATAYNMSSSFTSYRPDVGIFSSNAYTSRLYAPYSTSYSQITSFGGGEAGSGYLNSSVLSGYQGYYSGNRLDSSTLVMYQANSSVGHYKAAQSSSAYGGVPNAEYYVFNSSVNASYSDKRLSFVALHWGLTLAESAALYSAVQALRTAFGGGYV